MRKQGITGEMRVGPAMTPSVEVPNPHAGPHGCSATKACPWGPGKTFIGLTALLLLAYHRVLIDYVRFALQHELYSYVLLIPAVSCYLAWLHPARGEVDRSRAFAVALIPLSIGIALFLARPVLQARGFSLSPEDRYVMLIGSLVCGIVAVAVFSFGPGQARQFAFPLGFLFFFAPLPSGLLDSVNAFLQHASAEASYWMIQAGQVPVFKTGLLMQLPGITLEVAAECSGIRSTLVLFLTSLIASKLFLKRPLHRWILIASILPLAILRNGLRIFTIAMLCVHVDLGMIDSAIHHRGGPIFFVGSLVPLFLLLLWLKRREQKRDPVATVAGSSRKPH